LTCPRFDAILIGGCTSTQGATETHRMTSYVKPITKSGSPPDPAEANGRVQY
jgi:hypothetical protein